MSLGVTCGITSNRESVILQAAGAVLFSLPGTSLYEDLSNICIHPSEHRCNTLEAPQQRTACRLVHRTVHQSYTLSRLSCQSVTTPPFVSYSVCRHYCPLPNTRPVYSSVYCTGHSSHAQLNKRQHKGQQSAVQGAHMCVQYCKISHLESSVGYRAPAPSNGK